MNPAIHNSTEQGDLNLQKIKMLSEIFRVMVNPVTAQNAKDILAPGEIGLDFNEWTFYVKNPYNNEIVTPNSIAHLKTILDKFDPDTGILNADRIKGIKFYKSVEEVGYIPNYSLTMDTIIRQMEYPSIMYCIIESENLNITKIPVDRGILYIAKFSEDEVYAHFTDPVTSAIYNGQYDTEFHVFIGWRNINGDSANTRTIDEESVEIHDRVIDLTLADPYVGDLHSIKMRNKIPLPPNSSISINGAEKLPIYTADGEKLASQIPADSIMIFVFDKVNSRWIYVENHSSVNDTMLFIVNNKINDLIKK